jgi:quercetin dioxygenase-like cupin family protein
VEKENIYTAEEKNVNENYFTGNVIMRAVLGERNSAEQEMYHVIFLNGALTTLHYHESDQILIAMKGKGVVGLIDGIAVTKFEIDDVNHIMFLEKEGDTVCIPANKLHFHGAISGDENFSHIAIRKMHKADSTDGTISRAENKWQYDLISEEIGSKDAEKIKKIAKEIEKKIRAAISKNLSYLKDSS